MMQYTIYTDGNYSRIHNEGAFAFVILKGNEEIMRKAGLVKCETNNRAELKAIIAGVYSLPDDATEVRVISDSMYALKTLSGDWKRLKNQDLFYNWEKRVKAMRPNLCIEFMFVKGHSGDYYNELCDQLCVERLGYNPREGKKVKNSITRPKKLEMYDRDGKLIRTYDSIMQASKTSGDSYMVINRQLKTGIVTKNAIHIWKQV